MCLDCNHTMYLTVNRPNTYVLHHYFDMFDNVRVCNSETKTSQINEGAIPGTNKQIKTVVKIN